MTEMPSSKDDTFRIKVKDLFKKVLITIANSVETK